MTDRRSGKDRRINADRRISIISSYNGTENRGAKQQRSQKDRRETNRSLFTQTTSSHDHEGRRSGTDQRQFFYSGTIPERRSGKDRRRFV